MILFSIFIFNKSEKDKILFIIYIGIFVFVSFFFESSSWIKSWKLQQEIISNSKVKYINNNYKDRNLVIFFGPCKYNGIEIFNAPYDLGRAVKEQNLKSKNSFVPITNWKIEFDKDKKIIGFHNFYYKFIIKENFKKIIFWDYFKDELILMDIKSDSFEEQIKNINDYKVNKNCEIKSERYSKNLFKYEKILKKLSFLSLK